MKNQRIIADGLACLMTAFCITSCSSGDILKKFGSLEMQEYLCENFDANEDHKLSAQEVALITEVDLWSDIKSLEGVKYLKNLEDFSFDHCPSATIDLSKNECLRDFSCSFSENLKVIKMPKSIQSIGLYENAITELKFVDGNGAVVFLDANSLSLKLNGFPARCYGCIRCLEKYAEKGLLTFKILKEGSNHLVNVELTKKGEKYLMNNPNGLTIMEDGGYADVKLAEKKFCKVEEVFQNEKRAEFFVSYYMDYTPWAEAMGYNTDKKHIRTMRVTFTNNDGEWVIDETESTKRNG